MTATDELRRMLDERGVEWVPSVFDRQHETFYSTENGVGFIVTEFPEIGRMSLACDMRITPEQAIEATLGGDTQAEREAKQLRAENAKLRELVRELWNCALQYHRFDVYRHEIGVDGCGIGCTANGDGCCACKLEQRMRELGVEV